MTAILKWTSDNCYEKLDIGRRLNSVVFGLELMMLRHVQKSKMADMQPALSTGTPSSYSFVSPLTQFAGKRTAERVVLSCPSKNLTSIVKVPFAKTFNLTLITSQTVKKVLELNTSVESSDIR